MAKYLIGNIKGPKGDRGEAGPTYTAGDGISITNNVISATNSGGITTETDPVFSASPAAGITAQDITDWDAKSDFSGSYNDLTNKPDLSVYATTTALGTGLARKQDTLTAGTNITIDGNNVISAAAAEDELPTIASGDAGKVLTVNSGETGVEWTTPSSGSATYTAGKGIEIDANNEIRNTNPFNLSGVYATLFQSGSSTPNWGEAPTGRTTIEDIANDLLKTGISMVDGYSLFSGVSPAAINAVNNTNWAFKIWTRDNTYTWSSRYEASTSTSNLAQYRKNGVFIKTKYNEVAFFESLSVARNALMDNISNGIWVKAGTNFDSVRLPAAIAALDTAISNKQDALPAAPSTDGTYFLSTTVSSGTATQSWVSIPAANGNNF